MNKIQNYKVGNKYGKITVLFHNEDNICDCICSCGNIFRKKSGSLTPSGAKSCGCTNSLNKRYSKTITNHKLYSIWRDLKRSKNGGVEKIWEDYNNFYNWAIDKYKEGLRSYSKDFNKLHGPDNTIFVHPSIISKESQNRPEVKIKLTGRKPKYSKEQFNHPLYEKWISINKDSCDEWKEYLNFYSWGINKYQKKLTLIKINESLPYSEDNCIFISLSEFRSKSAKKTQSNIKVKFLSIKSTREKIKKTNIKKYGKEFISQVDEFKEKAKKTKLEKYGVEHYSQTEECKNRIKSTSLIKYGVDHHTKRVSYKKEIRESLKKNKTFKLYDGKLISEIVPDNLQYSTFQQRIQKYGYDIAITKEKYESGLETFFKDNIIFDLDYKTQERIGKFIPDFTINDLIIECDGLYWHSDWKLDKNYHKNKRDFYIENNYKPLFFREDEILNSKDIIRSIILNKLGKSNKIHARKCNFKKIEYKEAKEFCNNNHLMGAIAGRSYGLYYNNNLVSVMVVKKLKNSNSLDISRFCCLNNYSVIGGFSKLLKNIEKELNPDSIQTFIDLRYGSGNYLSSIGFTKETEYLSFKWTKGIYSVHRMNFPGNTGYSHGFNKIWDCGQAKWIKVKNS